MKRVFGFGDDDDVPPPAPKRPKLFGDDNFGAKKQASKLLVFMCSRAAVN
jgi:hypothetical protein